MSTYLRDTTLADKNKARAEVLAVLEEFHIPVAVFDARRNDSLEKIVAHQSPQRLRQLYLQLLDPGVNLRELHASLSQWPEGHRFTGGKPHLKALYSIRKGLIAARQASEEAEQRKLRLQERNTRLRERQMEIEQKKLQLKIDATNQPDPNKPVTNEPYDPIAEREKVRKMAERIYGINPHKNEPS